MNTVELKNGTTHLASFVSSIRSAIQHLFYDEPIAFNELVQLCRSPAHPIWKSSTRVLIEYSLLTKTTTGFIVHDGIRDIVLSATEGNGPNLKLVSPVRKGI
jgi:hypothetical protein